MSSESVDDVLVVEDHQPTAKILAAAFEEADEPISTTIVGNGRECLDALRGGHDATAVPDLVLLDLDLPDIDGLTVLEIRIEEPALRAIPTIVLSGTTDRETVRRCYRLGANAFVPKPEDFDGYVTVVEAVTSFWFATAELPDGLVDIDA